MLKLLIWVGMFYPKRFIRFLAKIEYNNSIYLKKLSNRASLENKIELKNLLIKQSKEEELHGKTLSRLVDKNKELIVKDNGYFTKIVNEDNQALVIINDSLEYGKEIEWYSKIFKTKVKSTFINLDGVSKRYFSSILFFKNKSAFEYSWEDQFAFIYILEREIQNFYNVLAKYKPQSLLSKVSFQFSKEEKEHSNIFNKLLSDSTSYSLLILLKWEIRLILGKVGLIVDLIKFIYSYSNY